MLGTCILRVGRAVLVLPPGAEAWGEGCGVRSCGYTVLPGQLPHSPLPSCTTSPPLATHLSGRERTAWREGVGTHTWWPRGLVSMCPLSAWGLMKAWGDPSLWT